MTLFERVKLYESLLRESLKVSGDGRWHRKVYEALGEPKPPVRQLKGKVPRYQLNLIGRGELEG